MAVLAPVIGAAVAFLTSPVGIAIVGGIALAVVGGFLLKSMTEQDASATAQSGGVETEFKVGEEVPVNAVFGRSHVAGHYIYHHTYGTSNEYLQMVYVLGNGVHDDLEYVFVDGERLELAGSNSDPYGRSVGGKYTVAATPYLWVKFYNGGVAQTADAQLIANSGGRWTSEHRAPGLCYAIVTYRYNEDVFGSSIPKMGFQIRGLRLYDWRKDSTRVGGSGLHRWNDQSTWEWTDNPAVGLYTYRRGLYTNGVLVLGQGASDYDCDMTRFTAAANLSDEDITFDDTGETMNRYGIDVNITDEADAQTVIRMFETAMGGYGTEIGGAYGPLPAQTQSSVATITDLDLDVSSSVVAQKKLPPSDSYTAVHGTYSEPGQAWQAVDYGIKFDDAVEAADGGRRLVTLDLPYITRLERAQMLAEILRRRDRFQATEEITVMPKFSGLEPGDVVTRTKTLFGSIPMMVISKEEVDGKLCRLLLRQWDNTIVPLGDEGFITLPPEIGTPIDPPALANTLVGLQVDAVALTNPDGDIRAGLKVSWDAITDPTIVRVILRYWPDTETEAEAQTVTIDSRLTQHSTVLTGLLQQTLYHVKGTIVTDPSRATVWSGVVDDTTVAETYTAVAADVGVDNLDANLAAIIGVLTGTGPGSVSATLDAILEEQARQAAAALDDQLTFQKKTESISRRLGSAVAFAVREQVARVSDTEAFASALEQVAAEFENSIASGLLQFQVVASEPGASATIAVKVRASVNDIAAETGLYLLAEANGDGTTRSELFVLAEKFYIKSVSGSSVVPFAVVEDQVVVGEMKFRRFESIAEAAPGVPVIVIDGDTGFESTTVAD